MRVLAGLAIGIALSFTPLMLGNGASQTPPPIVRTRPTAPTYTPTPLDEKYGEWSVGPLGAGLAAYVGNGSGSVFGVFCSGGCVAYLNAQTQCKADDKYPALINSSAGAFSVELECTVIGPRHLLVMPASDTIVDSFEIGGEIGIAFPLASGRFQVARFSLTGALKAANRVAALDATKTGRTKAQGDLRDYRI